jgi:hypothetical protein
MNIGDKITGRKVPLLGTRRDAGEQDRLLKLYWNRAELKKELAGLDDQLYQLRDRLKQQEATTERVLGEKEALEVLLGNPDFGFGALVHFQLRALWKACNVLLEQFVTELRRQQEDRERKRQLVEFHQDRQSRAKLAGERLAEAAAALDIEERTVAALRAELQGLTGFWHYFRRRRLTERLTRQSAQRDMAAQSLADIQDAKRTIEKEPWPEIAGLGIDGRRAINVAVLAYAQLLYAELAESGLAAQSRLARSKGVQEANYGSRHDCEHLMGDIAAALTTIRGQANLASEIKARSEALKAALRYEHPSEAVPIASSLPSAFLDRDGGVAVREPNLLTDDYWDVGKLLLR